MKAAVMFATVTGLAVLGGLWSAGAESKKKNVEINKVPVSPTRAHSGVAMFKTYCATCHGLDGKGGGPAAEALKVAPSDLTLLKQKNGGVYPAVRVSRVIERAEDIAAHGGSEMPIWGPIFESLDPYNKAVTELRIANLTKYIESIQH
jgi:mono/diheme cytochrome c family protein